MRILTRYILREVLAHALLGLALFTFVIFMRDVTRILELVVRNSAPLPSIAEIFFLTLPAAFVFTIPMAVLVGILIGLSRLAADSEITAMRASGYGVLFFLRPILIFSLVAWGLAIANSVYIAPRSAMALSALQASLRSSQASFAVQPRVFYEDLKNYVLYVRDVASASRTAAWKDVFLADVSSPGAPRVTTAGRAVVITEQPDVLHLHFVDGSEHDVPNPKNPAQYTISSFGETDIPIELADSSGGSQAPRDLNSVSEMRTGDLVALARASDPYRARWYWIEFHRRLALPGACLVLMLVGVPLGLSARKGGKATGFVLTIVLVFLYYFTLSAGIALARQGKMPAGPGVWMANLIFGIAGAVLCWQADRNSIELFSVQHVWQSLKQRLGWQGLAGSAPLIERRGRSRNYNSRYPLILDEYVLREFFMYFGLVLATFIVLTLVFSFFELLGDIIRNRTGLLTVGEYLFNLLPQMLYLMTPLSVLLAVLITFGLMEKSSELTAIKATGTSVYRLVVPVIVISGLFAGGLFAFDQFYLPQANKRQEALRNSIKGKPAQTFLRPDRRWIVGESAPRSNEPLRIYSYSLFDPDQDQFGDLSIFEFTPGKFQMRRRIFAQRAYWDTSLGKWVLQQGWERSFSGDTIEGFDSFDVTTLPEFAEPPAYFKKEVHQSSEMNFQELGQYIRDLQQGGFDVVRLRVQLYKKIAFPLITLVMAVLAVPFAVSAGKRGALGGVAIAITLAIVYWMTSGLFEAMGNVDYLPPLLAAWSPDMLFALLGGYLLLRIST